MSSISEQFQQLKALLSQLEESAIDHSVDTAEGILEALELAALIEIYEAEATSLLLQTSANLLERVKDQELEERELGFVVAKLKDVGYSDEEILELLALTSLDLMSETE